MPLILLLQALGYIQRAGRCCYVQCLLLPLQQAYNKSSFCRAAIWKRALPAVRQERFAAPRILGLSRPAPGHQLRGIEHNGDSQHRCRPQLSALLVELKEEAEFPNITLARAADGALPGREAACQGLVCTAMGAAVL